MHLRKRPDDRYAAWGLRFKLIDPPPHQRVLARMSVPLNIESEE
jgi:hypothetical protein